MRVLFWKLRRWATREFYTRRIRRRVGACGPGLKVNFPSVVTGGNAVRVGANVSFNGMQCFGEGGVTIGDNFHSGRECMILTVNHNYDSATSIPYDRTVVHKPVTIGDNVWLGHRVTIVPGATIGEGAVIGIGAVVAGEIPRCAVAVGNPAKVVKYRDVEHYERLKSMGRFH